MTQYYEAIGRRKESTARVRLASGSGKFIVNEKEAPAFFTRLGDLQERKLWQKYVEAYEDVLNKTSTPAAPWTIVPANHKWYRDWVIASSLVEALEGLEMKYPEPAESLAGVVIE